MNEPYVEEESRGIILPRLNENEIQEMIEDIYNHLEHQDELLVNIKNRNQTEEVRSIGQ